MPIETDGPALGINTNFVTDWTSNAPFLDMFKMARPFFAQRDWSPDDPEHWDPDIDHEADPFGWPTSIPEGTDYIGAIIMAQEEGSFAAGRYVIRYEGEGDIDMSGVTVISESDGRMVVDLAEGDSAWMHLQIRETDPNGTGNHIRDIQVVREDLEPLLDAGFTFDPDYVDKMEDFRSIRFMNWAATNGNDLEHWEDRPTLNDATYTTSYGIPIEAQIQLANELKVDPWFNVPHGADDNYIREMARLVRDNLDPDLTASIEYSNEVWNWSFEQSHYATEQAIERWGPDVEGGWMRFYGARSQEMADIWKEEFADSDSAPQLQTVLATHPAWLGLEQYMLQAIEGDVSDHFDLYATTTYFSGGLYNPDNYDTVRNWLEDPDGGFERAFAQIRGETEFPAGDTLADLANNLAYHANIAETHGLRLTAYEGGPHIVVDLFGADDPELTEFYIALNQHPEMGQLLEEMFSHWENVGGGELMYYKGIGESGRYGSWGLWENRFQEELSAKGEAALNFNETANIWWDDRDADVFSNGQMIIGGEGESDLIGGDNDDVLFAAHNDAQTVDGGAGEDLLILPHAWDQYQVEILEDGFRLSRGDTSIHITNVEAVNFAGTQEVTVAELTNQDPSTDPGENPDEDPGENPAEDPDQEPGKDPDVEPDEEPDGEPDEEPSEDPGENPEMPIVETLENGTVISRYPDGSITTQWPWGITEYQTPEGQRTQIHANGKREVFEVDGLHSWYLTDGTAGWENAEGDRAWIGLNGNSHTWYADGSESWTSEWGINGFRDPDGNETRTSEDGTVEHHYADGSGKTNWPDGSSQSWDGEGNRTTHHADGKIQNDYADGSWDYQAANGSGGSMSVDGVQIWYDGHGNSRQWNPDGSQEWQDEWGNRGSIDPDGVETVTFANGEQEIRHPDEAICNTDLCTEENTGYILTQGENEGGNMFIYNDLEQAGGLIKNFEAGRDVLDIRDLMLIAGQDANLEIRDSDTGAEIWISHADSGDFILTRLENVEASMLTAGQDIWM